MTEQAIQKKIIDKYEADGWFVIKLSRTNKPGIHDILALKRGERPTFIEVKKPGGKLSDLQKYRQKEVLAMGFDGYATASVDRFYCEKAALCGDQCKKCSDCIKDLYNY